MNHVWFCQPRTLYKARNENVRFRVIVVNTQFQGDKGKNKPSGQGEINL